MMNVAQGLYSAFASDIYGPSTPAICRRALCWITCFFLLSFRTPGGADVLPVADRNPVDGRHGEKGASRSGHQAAQKVSDLAFIVSPSKR